MDNEWWHYLQVVQLLTLERETESHCTIFYLKLKYELFLPTKVLKILASLELISMKNTKCDMNFVSTESKSVK